MTGHDDGRKADIKEYYQELAGDVLTPPRTLCLSSWPPDKYFPWFECDPTPPERTP